MTFKILNLEIKLSTKSKVAANILPCMLVLPQYMVVTPYSGQSRKISKMNMRLYGLVFVHTVSCKDVSANQVKALCTHYNWPLKYTIISKKDH